MIKPKNYWALHNFFKNKTNDTFEQASEKNIQVARLHSEKNNLNKLKKLDFNEYKATNLEMETEIIYGMSQLLGHKAISLSAILANRNLGEYSLNPEDTIERLIEYTLKRI